MEEITLSRVTPAEVEVLQEIGKKTFHETFAMHNSEQNMAAYMEYGFSANKLTKEVNNPCSEFYFAKLGQQVIGYLKINTGKAQTEIQGADGLEIERIYVLQHYHGKKVGQLLYESALQIAAAKNIAYVWLGVWEHNARAMRFYTKNGFVPFDKHIFKMGDDEQTDIMMKKLLK